MTDNQKDYPSYQIIYALPHCSNSFHGSIILMYINIPHSSPYHFNTILFVLFTVFFLMYPFCPQHSISIIFKTVTSFNWVFQKLNSIIFLISVFFQASYLYKLSFILQKTQLPLNPSNITYLAAGPLPLKLINLSLLILSITLTFFDPPYHFP